MKEEERIANILQLLDKHYPQSRTALRYSKPWELLIATILSAQCTDERVNEVSKVLFQKYRSIEDFTNADLKELEDDIRPTGFFRNKAKNIKECCNALLERYQGKIPEDIESLVTLPGVGRKTANVVLSNLYGIPGIVVDTHVKRLSQRLGLTKEKDPVKIEFDLMKKIPKEKWIDFSHQLISHGRRVCMARKPKCNDCFLLPYCPYGQGNQQDK